MTDTPAPIHKYHGTGNDFVIVDAADWSVDFSALAPAFCDRHRGVGADGVIVVESRSDEVPDRFDAIMTIYNRDGSRPQMCGNGIRCVARHLVEVHGFEPHVRVSTDAGERICIVERTGDDWSVDVDMGIAAEGPATDYPWGGRVFRLHPVNMGNPHGVTFSEATTEEVDAIGANFNDPNSPFPEGVNIEFVTVKGDRRLAVVVYERGVGRTQACGTGACAAAVAAWATGRTPSGPLTVELPGGELTIRREGKRVWMRGGVEYVFGGALRADWLKARTT